MKIKPFWKKQILQQVQTQHHKNLLLYQHWGRYYVDANNVNYSFGYNQKVWHIALEEKGILQHPWNAILILGFGVGSIAQLFRRNPPQVMVGVEIEKILLQWYQTYFALPWKVQLHCQDAYQFLQQCSQSFSLILIDLFIEDRVPEHCLKETFFTQITRHLTSEGLAIMNVLLKAQQKKVYQLLQPYQVDVVAVYDNLFFLFRP